MSIGSRFLVTEVPAYNIPHTYLYSAVGYFKISKNYMEMMLTKDKKKKLFKNSDVYHAYVFYWYINYYKASCFVGSHATRA